MRLTLAMTPILFLCATISGIAVPITRRILDPEGILNDVEGIAAFGGAPDLNRGP